ncbi:putative bacteriocin export ABC transporter [Clostridiaceae bacterium DONG20-135]|uniref:Putative bacteriocin export ABC transporter n=1 Tax=Copranaerobaculum intestinale TaxID=2692629 RepID=A0A6N8U8P4_9FIRM|nr:putative bacteriocin export ABC transporter [Copranaerobaculum intestinale]MXQ73724.1 putative bacteriocin export ABC transporter [Copranaerobaculum intestinale]
MEYIEVKNLVKRFDDHVILHDFNARFEKGTLTAITGESGCGKSTLLNIIGLIEKPTSGEILYQGFEGFKLGSRTVMNLLRYEIAYLFQNYALLDNETVEANLKIAMEYSKDKKDRTAISQALEKVNLSPAIITNKVYTLSGGEQQRVAMARILLKPCTVVLADEPTGNLDEENKAEIFQLLKLMAESGKIVIVVTHDQALAIQCHNKIHLDKQ